MEVDEVLGHGKSQARPTESRRDRVVRLAERFKDRLLALLADADPCVGHRHSYVTVGSTLRAYPDLASLWTQTHKVWLTTWASKKNA